MNCRNCGYPVEDGRKFCSRECYAEWHNASTIDMTLGGMELLEYVRDNYEVTATN